MTKAAIRKREVHGAKAALFDAHQALAGKRPNALKWLVYARRAFHPGSDAGRVAALLAALAPHNAAVQIRTLAAPLILSEHDLRAALAALERAGLLRVRSSLHIHSLELTLTMPAAPDAVAAPPKPPENPHDQPARHRPDRRPAHPDRPRHRCAG